MAKRLPCVRLLAMVALLLLLVPLLSLPVLAAELRGGDRATVGRGEVIDDDLYVFATTIVIDGTVNGDLVAAGQTVRVNGQVKGSVFAAAQTVTVAGKVDGSVNAGGQTVTVSGQVGGSVRIGGNTLVVTGEIGGDLLAGGSSLDIGSAATISRDLWFGSSEALLTGSVGRTVKGSGGQVTVAGTIEGHMDIQADTLRLMPGSRIGGNLEYTSENEAELGQGAVVAGTTTRRAPPPGAGHPTGAPGRFDTALGRVLGFVVAVLAGIALLYLAPRRVERMSRAIRHRVWPSLGWGLLTVLAAPVAILLALVLSIVISFRMPVAVIGIPLSVIAVALLVLAVYLSQVFVGLAIGRGVLGRFWALDRKGHLVLALAAGLAIVWLATAIPYLGVLLSFVTLLLGLGAIVASARMGENGGETGPQLTRDP